MRERAQKMFLGGRGHPKHSGMPVSGAIGTVLLVVLANRVVCSLWAEREKEVRKSSGLVNKEPLLGMLIGDMNGHEDMQEGDAYDLGKRCCARASAAETKLTTADKAARLALSKARRKEGFSEALAATLESKAAEARAKVLDAVYDPKIPVFKRQRVSPPTAPAPRKRGGASPAAVEAHDRRRAAERKYEAKEAVVDE